MPNIHIYLAIWSHEMEKEVGLSLALNRALLRAKPQSWYERLLVGHYSKPNFNVYACITLEGPYDLEAHIRLSMSMSQTHASTEPCKHPPRS